MLRQTDVHRDRKTDEETETERARERERQTDRQTDTQTHRQTGGRFFIPRYFDLKKGGGGGGGKSQCALGKPEKINKKEKNVVYTRGEGGEAGAVVQPRIAFLSPCMSPLGALRRNLSRRLDGSGHCFLE